ncbi:MAG: Uma2 family endonuclease [Candidatus Tectomicrobia bacterium]|uniref:Uma2 family endonuclease n=1 Tax=Tectimicrobiota bacterium TaxID=2528274 RepID=A0A937VYD0_UNCTE|nr:Uma2 family endonuclease [Candidatus Tectomicrobia bacterium]
MAWGPVPHRNHQWFTIDAYLALERTEAERHEYLDGCIYAMAGESPDHGRICMNVYGSLWPQLRGTPCEAFAKDTKVLCGPMPRDGQSMQGLFAYPDLVAVCGALQCHGPGAGCGAESSGHCGSVVPLHRSLRPGGEVPPLPPVASNAHGLRARGARSPGD